MCSAGSWPLIHYITWAPQHLSWNYDIAENLSHECVQHQPTEANTQSFGSVEASILFSIQTLASNIHLVTVQKLTFDPTFNIRPVTSDAVEKTIEHTACGSPKEFHFTVYKHLYNRMMKLSSYVSPELGFL